MSKQIDEALVLEINEILSHGLTRGFQLGSNNLNQKEFCILLKLNSTKRILPYIIQKHYESLKEKDEKLLEYKTKFEELTTLDEELWISFYRYNYYYNNYYNNNYNNYYNNNYNNYYNNNGNEFLLLIADVILQTLKEMNCEGCKYLHLVK